VEQRASPEASADNMGKQAKAPREEEGACAATKHNKLQKGNKTSYFKVRAAVLLPGSMLPGAMLSSSLK